MEQPAQAQTETAPTSRRWTGQTLGGVVGNWMFATVLRYAGLRWAYFFVYPVALYFLLTISSARRAAIEFRQRLTGQPAAGIRAWCSTYWHFVMFGKLLLDRVAMIAGPVDRFDVTFEGKAHLEEALADPKGLLIVSGHMGNFEGGAQVLTQLNRPVNMVIYDGDAPAVRAYFDRLLGDRQFKTIASDGSADASIAIMHALRNGEVVVMHADRCMTSRRCLVPFMGAPVALPAGPFAVAAISGATIMHVFAMRDATYRYRLIAFPKRKVASSTRRDRDAALRQEAEVFAAHLEEVVRRYPTQWRNFYKYWDVEHMSTTEAG